MMSQSTTSGLVNNNNNNNHNDNDNDNILLLDPPSSPDNISSNLNKSYDVIDQMEIKSGKSSKLSLTNSNSEDPNDNDLIESFTPIKLPEYSEIEEQGIEVDQSLINFKIQQKNLEKISKNMEQNKMRWKKLEDGLSSIPLDDDSDHRLIDWRISELKSMCSTRIRPEYIFDSLSSSLQEYTLFLMTLSKESFELKHRESWTSLDLFRYAGRMVQIINVIGISHNRYVYWKGKDYKGSQEIIREEEVSKMKYSINNDVRMSIITNPRFRSTSDIRQIMWFNQTVEPFTDLFPSNMDSELAKYISYEILDDNRIILYQDSIPQKLYYILVGKIELVYVYKLMQGEIHKSMGFLSHKQMNNIDNFEKGVPSATYLVARGQLEVLTIHIKDYLYLTNKTNVGIIRTFLHQINIFKNIEILQSTLDSHMIQIHYYKNDKVISQDNSKDAYLYVIKSGNVSVVRRQAVYDHDIFHLWTTSNVYSLGCVREGKHASTMINVNDRKVNFSTSPIVNKGPEKSESLAKPIATQSTIRIKPQTSIGMRRNNNKVNESEISTEFKKSQTMVEIKRPREMTSYKKDSTKHVSNNKQEKERMTYLKIDTLRSMDVFGLDTLENEKALDNYNLVLISEGAEVILINKRYFLDKIDNNTLLEIRKLMKSYISEEEARNLIDEENKWKAYKKILMKKMVLLHC